MSSDGEKKKANKARRAAEAKDSDARVALAENGVRLDRFGETLVAGKGFVLADLDPRATPAFDGGKKDGGAALDAGHDEFADLLERLHAESTAGSKRSILLVVQGMDTSGKGGILKHVIAINPEGVRATAFKAPTEEERAHHFLWRIEKALPGPGQLGVFDRSHYEDVLIVRVHDVVPKEVWSQRYAEINEFEHRVQESGTKVIKVMLHISKAEQKARLLTRLERPDKFWKFNPADVDERTRWIDYMEAYQAVLDQCSTDESPWYVVPADRKWYARLAVQQVVVEALREMDLQWPPADFDVEAEKKRLSES